MQACNPVQDFRRAVYHSGAVTEPFHSRTCQPLPRLNLIATVSRSVIVLATLGGSLRGQTSSSADAPGVGFRIVRTSKLDGPIAMWYPAQQSRRAPAMTVDDYLRAGADTHRLAAIRSDFLVGIARSYAGARGVAVEGPTVPPLPDSVARALLDFHGRAARGAKPLAGRFPTVIFTIPLGSTGAANVNLIAEDFASRGYVVVSGPPVTAAPGTSFTDYLRMIRANVAALYDATIREPNVDRSRVVALDPTGAVALWLEGERKRWRGIIAFDEQPFEPEIRDAIAAAAGSISTSVLYVPLADPAPNGALLAQLTRVDRVDAVIPGARHGLLSAYTAHFKQQLGQPVPPEYAEAMRRMREFLSRIRSP